MNRFVLCLFALTFSSHAAITVETSPGAPEIERFAAQELRRYLELLFQGKPSGAPPNLLFLIGSSFTNPIVSQALGGTAFPASEDGYAAVRTKWQGRPALVLGGGSPQGSLWAVYDLVEQWGVRYLIHRDVLPRNAVFRWPEFVREPLLRVRQWRVVNELPMGPASWSIADYRPVLDQLAKLRFNRVLVSLWQQQPFLRYSYGGITRQSSTMFFGHRFPVTGNMIGRWLFPPGSTEFENPDLPNDAPGDQQFNNGIAHVRMVMDYARQRGMDVAVTVNTTEFPREFSPILKGSRPVRQISELTITPGPETDIDDPDYVGLSNAVVQATIDTYPAASYLAVSMPEHRQWTHHYLKAWEYLDAKYNLTPVASIQSLLARAAARPGFPGGSERAQAEVKGDLVNLYLYDRLLSGKMIKVIYSAIAEELYPLLDRMLPTGSELLSFIDYTPTRVLRRKEALSKVPTGRVGAELIFTLHDDNVGSLPQLATHSLAELTQSLLQRGWKGFSTRYWLLGDHDSAVSYIAKASWQADITPEAVNRKLLLAICGLRCVQPALQGLGALEEATKLLEWHGLGFAFPIPNMLMKHWGKPPAAEINDVRRLYVAALEKIDAAVQLSQPKNPAELLYLKGRLQFGIGYLDAVGNVAAAGIAEDAGNRAESLRRIQAAVSILRNAIESYARVAKDQSDRGAIATLNEFAWRPLNTKLAELSR